MTTDELIKALRDQANENGCWNDGCWNRCKKLLHAAADRMESVVKLLGEVAEKLEEKEKIIRRYKQADTFLAAHGWEWKEDADGGKRA